MRITLEEVRETARLARLALAPGEAARMAETLDAILGYVERLAALDVDGVEPMTHAVSLAAPLRDDVPGPELGASRALAAAPASDDGYFRVPRVIAHDKEA